MGKILRITVCPQAPRFQASAIAGVLIPLLVWTASLPASGKDSTARSLEAALRDQGWQILTQPDGSSLVLPPGESGEQFLFRGKKTQAATQDAPGTVAESAGREKQPTSTPAAAAVAGKATTADRPTKAAAPTESPPVAAPRTYSGYQRSGPGHHWRERYHRRYRPWQRHRHHPRSSRHRPTTPPSAR